VIDENSIRFLMEQGEGHNVEFKLSFSNGLSKDVCAFANASGGKVLLGVDDNGTVKGIKVTNMLRSQVQNLARNMDPPLQIGVEAFKNILVIDVPEGMQKPHSTNGKFYMRYGANSQQLTRNEIRDLFRHERLLLFDDIPNQKFNPVNDVSEEAFRTFTTLAGIRTAVNRERLFENLLLTEHGRMKNAGVLLFCDTVTRFFLNATITCVLYQGRTKVKILDRKEYDRDIYSNFRDAMIYLQRHLDTEYIIRGGPREEKLELPEEALREAILNATAHRDYFSTANIQVSIFKDRVEMTNPGGLIGDMTVEDLYGRSMPRNPLLFGMMQRMNLVEKVGSGLLRINALLEEEGLPAVRVDADRNWFTVTFDRPSAGPAEEPPKEPSKEPPKEPSKEPPKEILQEHLSELEQKILAELKRNGTATRNDIARSLGISPDTVKEYLERLKKKNAIRRIGGRRYGSWEVTVDDE